MTLFGYHGISAANSSSSGSAQISSPRFARFREVSNLGSCINFQRKPRRTNSSQGARVASESFVTQLCSRMTPTYHCATFNETLFERKRFQVRFLVLQAKTSGRRRRGHHDSPPPKQQEFVSLQIASFANQAVRTELLLSTNVCRQLRHRRLPLLESLAADDNLATPSQSTRMPGYQRHV